MYNYKKNINMLYVYVFYSSMYIELCSIKRSCKLFKNIYTLNCKINKY